MCAARVATFDMAFQITQREKHMKTLTTTGADTRAAGSIQARGPRPSGMSDAKQIIMGLVFAAAVVLPHGHAVAMSVDLGVASGFAVLGGSGITITGATTVTGDMGSYPNAAITGLANLILDGVNHAGDATSPMAHSDLLIAYGDAAGRMPTTLYGAAFDLGGLTLAPGVYNGTSSLGLTGTLTLDAGGNPDAVWIFQAGSTLITASGSRVVLTGGAQADNVFWQVGSSATLDTSSYFAGNILALQSITLNTGATVGGRVLALNGAVTFDNNSLTVPEASTLHLLGVGIATLAAFRRRRVSPLA